MLVVGCTNDGAGMMAPGAGGAPQAPDGNAGVGGASEMPVGGSAGATEPGAAGAGESAGAAEPGPGAFEQDFADSAAFFTNMSAPVKGLPSSPHGYVQIFYSANIEAMIGQPTFQVPVGTVAIKRQSSKDDGVVDALTVMIKLEEGADPDTADWLFESRKADGSLGTSGGTSLQFCADCHARWPETSNLAGTTFAN